MKEMQDRIGKWSREVFDNTGAGLAAHALKENVELCRACGHDDLTIIGMVLSELRKPRKEGVANTHEEAADVVILILSFADYCHFDLATAIEQKFAVIQQRNWQEPDEFGIIEHRDY